MGAKAGLKIATPVFDGASYEDVVDLLKEAGLPPSGKIQLRDGRTGEPFDHEVTVGPYICLNYVTWSMIKSCAFYWSYSLVTQQPSGWKISVWWAEVRRVGSVGTGSIWSSLHHAADSYCESDDLMGRSKIYEAIVKGENTPEAGIPESFKVLVREIKALALDIDILTGEETAA
jgi:DNA-directed RNA polymerase subunit beta